ncbi:TIGR03118 family protein [Aetokthonos hydrillicola Thurmond2011]|uniref:TIGR03118 family protein n=2 Tax=Aetokthonos TaxID=1550243 RepID=A0AAP5I5V6_9CYAN|nr:TIGR03118 family protein [Aetokthonos hydrillicola]MBO3459279.1 TIGR03118 family protein [Aetokthonos hydrillicola CCALA 1050]MBW4590589.1 TIGR03118 family protein [Aetokthonos hydrillicola CCALA 1050]MDR9894354.1 TIGR03118 family protein [Aetokthonos hydrillicola Thurmond2011]
MNRLTKTLLCSLLALSTAMPAAAGNSADNRYTETRFVANKASYKPETVDPKLINAWGIAIRPAGAGGHFWVGGKNISFEYVGDVQASSDPTLRRLTTDPQLTYVSLPVGGDDNTATGVVFSDSTNNFVITQQVKNAAPITAPAKFLFASDGGIISAWTERKKIDGTFDRPLEAVAVIDQSKDGAQFFGLAVNKDYSRLYAADFGAHPGIKVFDGQFKPLPIYFEQPFDTNKNGQVDPGEYAPFNIQALTTPQGESHLFITYAKTQACPKEEIAKGTCAKGELFAGEEDTSKPGQGRLAEFTEDGRLVAVWKDGGRLSAPWGVAFAPNDFGALSGMLLVGNFGDGHISAFDPTTRQFREFMRNEKGRPVKIDKLWGLLFGNGQSLGDSNALYFSAGPNDEQDGLFGSLRVASKRW